jgi:hypothetical protein
MSRREYNRFGAWDDFSEALEAIVKAYNTSYDDAMRYIGYAGGSNLAEWRKAGKAPTLAINAARWVAHDAGAPQAPKLDQDDISRIFWVLIGNQLPPEHLHELRGKLATQLSQR